MAVIPAAIGIDIDIDIGVGRYSVYIIVLTRNVILCTVHGYVSLARNVFVLLLIPGIYRTQPP